MRSKRLATTVAAAAIALAAISAPASAQRWGTVEVGGFVNYTMFGDVLELDNTVGVGGMLGFFIFPNLVAEGDLSFMRTEGPLTSGKITYRPVHARLAYHIPITERLKIPLGLGYTLGVYDGDETYNEYEDAFGLLAGIKYYFHPSWAFNVEALFDRFPSPANQVDPTDKSGYWNNSLRAGVNWIYPSLERCVVTITPQTVALAPGETRTFTATARGERSGRPCRGPIAFTSSDNAITPVGVYSPRTAGQHTITATYRGRSGTASATVNAPPPPPPPPPPVTLAGIDLRPDSATVLRGETVQFSVVGRLRDGRDTTVTATYSGGNIDPNGLFTAGNDTGVVEVTATVTQAGQTFTDRSPVRVVRLRSTIVNFDLGADSLDAGTRDVLTRLAQSLRANPRATVRIEGHTDTIPPRGTRNAAASRRFNERLSLARADSVTAFLLAQQVDRARFEPRIRGFSFCVPQVPHRAPADYEKDAQGRPLGERANRRVEIFEIVADPGEPIRWVCGGRIEPATKATPQR